MAAVTRTPNTAPRTRFNNVYPPYGHRRVPWRGKTTLVNDLLAHSDERIAVVVDDLGELNIDPRLIRSAKENTIELANGCICCNLSRAEPHCVGSAAGISGGAVVPPTAPILQPDGGDVLQSDYRRVSGYDVMLQRRSWYCSGLPRRRQGSLSQRHCPWPNPTVLCRLLYTKLTKIVMHTHIFPDLVYCGIQSYATGGYSCLTPPLSVTYGRGAGRPPTSRSSVAGLAQSSHTIRRRPRPVSP
ncbi:GTP-binding protein [Arthrobacter sp. A5]|uniref:GTP-binding protein n=1 Tax=Arthrobacter sp. A5 TaxID=576926 RepID=UPI003DA7CA7D